MCKQHKKYSPEQKVEIILKWAKKKYAAQRQRVIFDNRPQFIAKGF